MPCSQAFTNGQTLQASISSNLSYNFPLGFTSQNNCTFVNSTVTTDATTTNLFQSTNKAALISYSDEFPKLVGPFPKIQLVQRHDTVFDFEAGVWIPEIRQVWFTSAAQALPVQISILYLDTNIVRKLNTIGTLVVNPSGGYCYNGAVNFGCSGGFLETQRCGIAKVDVNNFQAKTVLYSYFGLRIDG